jgi:hypothetical protein
MVIQFDASQLDTPLPATHPLAIAAILRRIKAINQQVMHMLWSILWREFPLLLLLRPLMTTVHNSPIHPGHKESPSLGHSLEWKCATQISDGKTGLLLRPGDPSSLSAALITILQNHERKQLNRLIRATTASKWLARTRARRTASRARTGNARFAGGFKRIKPRRTSRTRSQRQWREPSQVIVFFLLRAFVNFGVKGHFIKPIDQ